jgi:hypothetical protein
MYTTINFKTKKALKEAVKNGDKISVYQPNNMFNVQIPSNGVVTIEGPHYPKPHTWYSRVTLQDGYIIKVS